MLSDRDYMRKPLEPERRSFQVNGNKLLMIALVVIFFGQALIKNVSGFSLSEIFGLTPQDVVHRFHFWQPFTYMVLHPTGSLFEIIFTLIGLFFFGPIVESIWGRRKYLILFFVAGLFAGLVYTPIAYVFQHADKPLLGSVPAVLSILVMASMARPNMTVLLFFVVPMKMKYLIWLFVGIDLFMLVGSGIGAVSQSVPHLAGAAFGFLYFRYYRSIDAFFQDLEPRDEQGSTNVSRSVESSRMDSASGYSEEVDEILDKIHQEGINSLTPEERDVLEKASDELKGDDRYGSFPPNTR